MSESPSPADGDIPAPPAASIRDAIADAIRTVFDPEIPVNIWELGLVYSVEVAGDGVAHVVMTVTAPACPVAGTLPLQVAERVKAVPGVTDAKVDLVWEPPWKPEMMSEVAKTQLGWMG